MSNRIAGNDVSAPDVDAVDTRPFNQRKSDLYNIIDNLQERINTLERILSEKNDLIEGMEQRLKAVDGYAIELVETHSDHEEPKEMQAMVEGKQ